MFELFWNLERLHSSYYLYIQSILKIYTIGNNYDFRDIWNLLFNSNKSLIRKINKVSPEDNKQQMESKEDAAEEENSNQFNFVLL